MNPAGKLTPNCAVLPAGRAPVGAADVRPSVCSVKRTRGVRAFSLFEMVIVVGLMGLLAALALPSMKLGKGSQMSAATRQLLDDLTLARLRAINNRSMVYVVFFPGVQSFPLITPAYPAAYMNNFFTTNQAANHLLGSQKAAYAIYAKRTLGDQPGQANSRYMSEWKTLPDGIFFGYSTTLLNCFSNTAVFCNYVAGTPRPLDPIIFPDNSSGNPTLYLPYIAFNEKGALVGPVADIRIPLAVGSLLPARGPAGDFLVTEIDALETPKLNSVTNYNWLVINWQTGRARVERPELP